MIYVKVGNALYPATVSGKMTDKEWAGRESKAITIDGDYETVNALFHDGVEWSIVQDEIVTDENGNETTERTEFGNADFVVRGSVTVHTNGTCTVKMGKKTDGEMLAELMEVLNND